MPPVRPPPAEFLPGRLSIERGSPRDYFALEQFHYARKRPATWAGVWVVRYRADPSIVPHHDEPASRVVAAGVLSYPTPRCLPRERWLGLPAPARYAQHVPFVNRCVRTISRVVVHPQFRALGLSTLLVRRMLDECPTRYVEASAVMARAHPLFDAAGMHRIDPPPGDGRRPVYFIFDKEGSRCETDKNK
jgi:GNAT superfamily N-acetyltransferase